MIPTDSLTAQLVWELSISSRSEHPPNITDQILLHISQTNSAPHFALAQNEYKNESGLVFFVMFLTNLVFAGPESADSEVHLVPLAPLGAGDIPHGAAFRTPVDPDVDLQGSGTVAIAAVQEEAELDAVGVVLAEGKQVQLSSLTPEMLRGIDHHEGPWW